MILTKYHFGYVEPEPKKKKYGWHNQESFDDMPSGWMFEGGEDAYQKAHTEWKRKNIKPEPEWISFEEREPKKGQPDKSTYDQQLSYYNEHQQIFEGWELEEKTDLYTSFSKGELYVEIYTDGSVTIFHPDSPVINVALSKCSVGLFKSICKLNGIEP